MQQQAEVEFSMGFNDGAVQELAWAIAAPAMLGGSDPWVWSTATWYSEQGERARDWLIELDKQPAGLHRFLEQEPDRRLGARFERLLEFWLDNCADYELLQRRLQCHDHDRTIGEFDFLVNNCRTGETEHWEVASKFYLGFVHPDAPHDLEWVGPGKRDRLRRKEHHLLNKQVMLGQTPAGQSLLRSLGISLDRVRAIVKGRLFYPLGCTLAPGGSTLLTANHERGHWCARTVGHGLSMHGWVPKPKTRWLEPPAKSPRTMQGIGNFSEFLAQTDDGPVCADIYLMTGRCERFMFVADDWSDELLS